MLGPGPKRWRGVAAIVPFLILIALGYWYTNRVQQQTERKLCRLISVMTEDAPPPTTDRAKKIAAAMEEFRRSLDC